MKYLDLARRYEDYIIALRRHFHENPEISNKEENTVARIAEELTAMGIEHTIIPKGGILAQIRGKTDNGRSVLLRADIDALPVTESDENLKCKRTCKSKAEGVMHACGHDGHTAMLLGAAKILLECRDEIEGTVYLCFERGEEGTGNVLYILAYMEKNGIKVDSAFGIHLRSSLKSGIFGINDTNVMASCTGFSVTIEGQGGHGSRPDLAVNPIDAFVDIYSGMQSIRMNHISPYIPLTYSIGKVVSGSANNVIPQTLTFGGTIRTFDREKGGMVFRRELFALIEQTCARHGCKIASIRINRPGFAVINDPESAQLAGTAIGEAIGDEHISAVTPWMGADSFALFQYLFSGVYALLGVCNEEKGIGAAHHSPEFDLDEDVLHLGSAAEAAYAIAFLKSGIVNTGKIAAEGLRSYFKEMDREREIPRFLGE